MDNICESRNKVIQVKKKAIFLDLKNKTRIIDRVIDCD